MAISCEVLITYKKDPDKKDSDVLLHRPVKAGKQWNKNRSR